MLDAVLFDWGDTLMRFDWDDERVAVGQAAGLEAAGIEPFADAEAVSRRFIDHINAHYGSGVPEELEYPGLIRAILGEFGIALDDEQLAAFLEAEHAAWDPARRAEYHDPAVMADAFVYLALQDGRGVTGRRFDACQLVERVHREGWNLSHE